MKIRKYICNDCHNPFWVLDDMEHDDVVGCPYCYCEDEGIENQNTTITIPAGEEGAKDGK